VALNGVVFIPPRRGGNALPRSAICVLHVSGALRRFASRRFPGLEDAHDRPAAENWDEQRGIGSVGNFRRTVWSAPTVDTKRGLLYVATGDNYSVPATTTSDAVMALDLKRDASSGPTSARERCLYVRLPD
jgi:hypothetical protein